MALERLERSQCARVAVKLDDGEDAAVVVHREARLPQPRRPIGGQFCIQLGSPQAAALDVLGLEPISHECVQRLVLNFIGHIVFYTT
jgi:hypothetical protein